MKLVSAQGLCSDQYLYRNFRKGLSVCEAKMRQWVYILISSLKQLVENCTVFDVYCNFPIVCILGLLIDNNVLGYNWEFLKDGMSLDVNTNVKNTETTYGIMFHTHFANGSDAIANKEWADYLSTFFDYNTDNENIMLSIARKSLSKEVSTNHLLNHRIIESLIES